MGPGGQSFARVDDIVTFNNWGPRLGASFDLTGDAKTVAKVSYGQFWLYPARTSRRASTPTLRCGSSAGWTDRNGNGIFDTGEQGVQLVQGGRASTVFDENLENTYMNQFTAYVERELVSNFGVRTGGLERPAPGPWPDQREPAARGLHRAGHLRRPRA